ADIQGSRWRGSSTTIAAEIATAIAVKNQRCQPPAPARKLNAAPVLCVRTRLKKPVTSSTSPGENARLTQALVARSAATTAAERANQSVQRGARSGMGAILVTAREVAHAARADRGMG